MRGDTNRLRNHNGMGNEMKWYEKILEERNEMRNEISEPSSEKINDSLKKEILSQISEPFPTRLWVDVQLTRFDPIADEWYHRRAIDIIKSLQIDEWFYLRTKKTLCCHVVLRNVLKLAKNPFVGKIESPKN